MLVKSISGECHKTVIWIHASAQLARCQLVKVLITSVAKCFTPAVFMIYLRARWHVSDIFHSPSSLPTLSRHHHYESWHQTSPVIWAWLPYRLADIALCWCMDPDCSWGCVGMACFSPVNVRILTTSSFFLFCRAALFCFSIHRRSSRLQSQ